MTTEQKDAALKIARALDIFAEEMDPFGFRDYLDEFCHGSKEESVQNVLQDFLNHDADYHLEWLAENVNDENLAIEDRARAEDLYDKLSAWVYETRTTKGE